MHRHDPRTGSFVEANEFGTHYEQFRDISDYGTSFDEETYERKGHDFDSLSSDLSQITDFIEQLNEMPMLRPIGTLLVIEGKTCKNTMLSHLPPAKDTMVDLLIKLGRADTAKLLEEFNHASKSIKVHKGEQTLDDFADFVDKRNVQRDGEEKRGTWFEVTMKIYDLLHFYNAQVPTDDKANKKYLETAKEWV